MEIYINLTGIMFTAETTVRVRYGETDQMGYVYYGNYAEYYEVGRVEALRQLGMTYKSLEENDIMLPVYSFSVKYLKPALYDDLLTVRTSIISVSQARICFEYETYNEKKELLNQGATTLVFIDRKTKKPCAAPGYFLEKIKKFL